MAERAHYFFKVPVFLLLLNLAAFGVLIPWLGFYWDDWPSIWFLHNLGSQGFAQVFASDRPLLGWLFRLTTPIFGTSTVAWQIFGFTTRWLSSLAFWWLLRLTFPKHPRLADWSAMLFAIYPGFAQQYIAVTYSHVFLLQALFFLSLGWMMQAARSSKPGITSVGWGWLGLSLLGSTYTMFAVEYFFGLELLRPWLLWLVQSGVERRRRFLRTIALWTPYLIVMLFFLLWRIVWTPTPRGQITLLTNLRNGPSAALADLFLDNIFPDIIESSILAWSQTLNFLRLHDFGQMAILSFAAIAVSTMVISGLWLWRYTRSTPVEHRSTDSWQVILLGVFALFAAGWPFWATNLPIELRFPWDRFTLAMMPGASLLLAGLVDVLKRFKTLQISLIAILIGSAIGMHYERANLYRREWNQQKAFFWQLSWRAPALVPGTLLLTSELPFLHYSDNSLTAPLNWLYGPLTSPDPMPYMLASLESRLGGAIQTIRPGLEVEIPYRAREFTGSTDQAIVLYFTPPGCLKLLDPVRDARLPQKPKYLSDTMQLSRLELVIPQPIKVAQPPESIFGAQPEPDWCYYFEKAELALQQEKWQEINDLGEYAFELHTTLYEVNAPEILPYLEAAAHTDNWQKAAQLTRQAYQLSGRMQRSLCSLWSRLLDQTQDTPQRQQEFDSLQTLLKCN